MAKQNMAIRIESELKEKVSALFKELGLDMSTATGIFYRQALRYHGLPFEVRTDVPKEETLEAMESSERDEDLYGSFDNMKDLMEALNLR